ncbi:MAG: ABC transporter permease [Gaiellales bacterium]|nr:MAG: ABC transporter permease [Gaiellales bacterium]
MTTLLFIIRRLIQLLLVLTGTVTVLFVVMYLLVPGDAAQVALGNKATPEALEVLRREWGLDRPVITQYGMYLWRLAHLDLGESFERHRSVVSVIGDHLPATAYLAGASLLLEAVIGCIWGLARVLSRRRRFEVISLLFGALLMAIPVFFLGMLLRYLFASKLGLLPLSGLGDWSPLNLVLPATTLAAAQIIIVSMITRTTLSAELDKPYMMAARARGLSRRAAILRHGIRNSAGPVVTILAIDFGSLLGGAMITEIVFSWPGVGRMAYFAAQSRDVPLVLGSVLVLVTIFVVINTLADVVHGALDPRIRSGGRAVG